MYRCWKETGRISGRGFRPIFLCSLYSARIVPAPIRTRKRRTLSTLLSRKAIRSQEAALNKIQDFVEQEVTKIAALTVKKLGEMDPNLAKTLSPEIAVKPWSGLFKVSITGENNIPINKRGSGVRRLILLGFFRAKAELLRSQGNKQTIIYGIEEPETSQHPHNQRLLISVLQELSSIEQVILTTHTPTLARVLPDRCLRFLNVRADGSSEVLEGGNQATNEAIALSLGILPDHNVKVFVGVAGLNDVPFLRNLAKILIAGGEAVPDLGEMELDGNLMFIPYGGGESLAQWADRMQRLNRSQFHLCDRDTRPPAAAKHQNHVDTVNQLPGCQACSTDKREAEITFTTRR